MKFHNQGRAMWASTAADVGLRFADGILWREGESQRLARYRGKHWELGSEYFEDIGIDEQVVVHFQSTSGQNSPEYGPFECFKTRDAMAYTGDRVFARYSKDENEWVHEESGGHWEAMVLRRAVK